MADAPDLGSGAFVAWGFESLLRHHCSLNVSGCFCILQSSSNCPCGGLFAFWDISGYPPGHRNRLPYFSIY